MRIKNCLVFDGATNIAQFSSVYINGITSDMLELNARPFLEMSDIIVEVELLKGSNHTRHMDQILVHSVVVNNWQRSKHLSLKYLLSLISSSMVPSD